MHFSHNYWYLVTDNVYLKVLYLWVFATADVREVISTTTRDWDSLVRVDRFTQLPEAGRMNSSSVRKDNYRKSHDQLSSTVVFRVNKIWFWMIVAPFTQPQWPLSLSLKASSRHHPKSEMRHTIQFSHRGCQAFERLSLCMCIQRKT